MEYTTAEHQIWKRLYTRLEPCWERYANPAFLEGQAKLALEADRIPELWEVNSRLAPLTGFRAVPVEGYIPAVEFFDHLRMREFPTVTAIRPETQIDYLPEPDIFHDVAGHVPMHTDPMFADALAGYGRLAAELAGREEVPGQLARFFWFTIEFGLMETPQGLRAYGSGLLSSHGELAYSLTSPRVERRTFDLEEVLRTPFEIDHYQDRLYVIAGFDELYDAVKRLQIEFAPLGFRQEEDERGPDKEIAGIEHQRPA